MTAAEPTQTAGAGSAPASPEAAPEPSAAPSESDFKARAQHDPNFAWEQVRNFQSRADSAASAEEKARAQIEKVGADVMRFIDAAGGESVAAALKNYVALRSNPEFQPLLAALEATGQVPSLQGKKAPGQGMNNDDLGDDGYQTPEEIAIAELRQQVADLKSKVGATSMASGRQVLQQHIEGVFQDYGFGSDVNEKMKAKVVETFESWRNIGPDGERAIANVQMPTGKAQVQAIMLSALSPKDLREAAANAALREKDGLSSLSTGGPPQGSASIGLEAPDNFASAAEAANYARTNPRGHRSE